MGGVSAEWRYDTVNVGINRITLRCCVHTLLQWLYNDRSTLDSKAYEKSKKIKTNALPYTPQ